MLRGGPHDGREGLLPWDDLQGLEFPNMLPGSISGTDGPVLRYRRRGAVEHTEDGASVAPYYFVPD